MLVGDVTLMNPAHDYIVGDKIGVPDQWKSDELYCLITIEGSGCHLIAAPLFYCSVAGCGYGSVHTSLVP